MKSSTLLVSLPLLLLAVSCGRADRFDKQAHRGGRGLMPENTIASEENAINYDCTMEMDLQMSRDGKIVVSHDAYFNSAFCLTPQGDTMSRAGGMSRLIYNMPYDSVARYDVGMKPYPALPRQKKTHAVKPLLSVLIDSVEAYGNRRHHVDHYNIEIKSNPKWDGIHYPSLGAYVDSAMAVIERKGIASRTMIQSFDVRALRMVHRKYPSMEISYLVDAKDKKDVQGYIDDLGFKPDVFSPEFSLVTADRVKAFHKSNILVIPWTPDKLEDMQRLKNMGVDGMITDYPDLYQKLQ
jgi:glycerophosphoryl diester phosphodiesterase